MPIRNLPQQKRSIENYQNILDSAVKLISSRGAQNITTNDIAEHAGIAVGSIYRFFENVEDIKGAIVDRYLEQQYQHMQSVFNSEEDVCVDVFVEQIINQLAQFYQANRDTEKVLYIMRTTEAFVIRNEAFNKRLFHELMARLKQHYDIIDQWGLENRLAILLHISDAMTVMMASCESEQRYNAYLAEWRLLFRGYSLNAYLLKK